MLEIDARGFGLARLSGLNVRSPVLANCPSCPIGVWNSPRQSFCQSYYNSGLNSESESNTAQVCLLPPVAFCGFSD
jgi:hypothetical protein